VADALIDSRSPTAAAPPPGPAAPASPSLADRELMLFAPVYPLPRLELVSGRGARGAPAPGRR